MNDAIARASDIRWFHAIDFGNWQSRGRGDIEGPHNLSLFGVYDILRHIDLHGRRCLDIGTASGLVAFGLKAMGADYVAAVDAFDQPSFRLAQEALALDVDFRPGVGIRDIPNENFGGGFDVVVCPGVLYHLLNPFDLFWAVKRVIKPGGIFILQSIVDQTASGASITLNLDGSANRDPTTFILPSVRAMGYFMRLACFDIITRRSLKGNPFFAVAGRSVLDPSEVSHRGTHIAGVHGLFLDKPFYTFGDYTFGDFTSSPHSASEVTISRIDDNATIDIASYTPSFPLNPIGPLKNPIGAQFR